MNILITGSTGYFGRYLIPQLIENNHNVLEITRSLDKSFELFADSTEKLLLINKQNEMIEAVENFNPDIVIHLAAHLTSNDDYKSMLKLYDSNILFLGKILDMVKNCNLKLFINTGTFAEYDHKKDCLDPKYLYSATKTASRSLIQYYSKVYCFKVCTMVPFTVYGGKDTQKKIIDIIYDSINSKFPINLSPGEQLLDFVHIDDVVDSFLTVINQESEINRNYVMHIGTGVGHTLKDLALLIEKHSEKKTNVNWGGINYRKSDIMYAVAKDVNDLAWKAQINLSDGIKKYLKNV